MMVCAKLRENLLVSLVVFILCSDNKRQMSEMSSEFAEYQENNAELRENLDTLDADHVALQHNYEELQEAYTKMQDEHYEDRIRDLKNEISRLTEKNETLTNENGKLNSKVQEFTSKLGEVNEAYNQTVGLLEAAQKQIEVLEQKNSELVNDKIPHMNSELTELQQNYDMLLHYSTVSVQSTLIFFFDSYKYYSNMTNL